MSERRVVLDSYSVLAFLENEKGANTVSDLLKHAQDKNNPLLLSVINWGEIYTIALREAGKTAAEKTLQQIEALPIEIIPVDQELTRIAAEFKAVRKMSYADCFAAALAKLKKAELVTGDKEFKEVEDTVKILWL